MSRMADRILSDGVILPLWARDIEVAQISAEHVNALVAAKLKQAQVIEASNVCEFFYAGTGQEHWNIKEDFPNLAPPFPLFWVEMRRPSKIVSDEAGERPTWDFPHCVGLLFEAFEGEAGRRNFEEIRPRTPTEGLQQKVDAWCGLLGPSIEEKRRRYGRTAAWYYLTREEKEFTLLVRDYRIAREADQLRENFPAGGWTYRVDLFVAFEKNRVTGPLACWVIVVSERGEGLFRYRAIPYFVTARSKPDLDTLNGLDQPISPGLLALSFMHCRNVTRTLNTPAPALNKKYRRSHGVDLVRYHTLEIRPFREILRREGGMATGASMQRALHICRGHFRTYQDRGLFGKYKGTFWIPMHVRGTAGEGMVVKDYRVRGPVES